MRTETPRCTYRLQLHAGFTFDDAAAAVPRLAALGVSHVYCSPYLQAAPGSTHGYDVVDHSRASSELGGDEGRRRFVAALDAHGMSHVLDVVPNHVSVAPGCGNRWWWDVLEHGSASPWTGFFDIDYDVAHATRLEERGRLVIPVLGDDGEDGLSLVQEDGRLRIAYHDHRFPVADGTGRLGDVPREVHARQHYVLVDWRRGGEQLNYRRFFDVSDLASIRVEDRRVFDETHRAILGWVADGSLAGLRIDHPDGLADPAGYLHRLREAAPDAWVVVEKILETGEQLPHDWPVAGTTGYDALREVGGLFVDPRGEQPLTALYAELTGQPTDWAALVHERKLTAATTVLSAETSRLASLLTRLGTTDPELGEYDQDTWYSVVAELTAALPVYRTYLRALWPAAPDQLSVLDGAVTAAVARRPDLEAPVRLLARHLADPAPGLDAELATRWQQTSGMVMAKGVEDTAFYRFHRLVALNEVGGDPGEFGASLDAFHEAAGTRQRTWPASMTTLTTHDTKRSEDVRARLALLSELPDEWSAAVRRWDARFSDLVDANLRYLLWQTLVGAWPISPDRLLAYLEKASREAKQHTSWVDPDPAYDAALRSLVQRVADDTGLLADVAGFVDRLAPAWYATALAQKLVQLTMPGVPDVYQGSELWTLSLVDPDNRRPVDHELLARLAADVAAASPDEIWARREEGLPKLAVVLAALRLRADRPDAFGSKGRYRPLRAIGERAEHLVAFVRGDDEAITMAPRLAVGLGDDWRRTSVSIPPGDWYDVVNRRPVAGGEQQVADLLSPLPVALLRRERP